MPSRTHERTVFAEYQPHYVWHYVYEIRYSRPGSRSYSISPFNSYFLLHTTTTHLIAYTVILPNMTHSRPTKKVRSSLHAVLMRAGTSKGLFIHRHHLPASQSDWVEPLLAVMGSQNSDARQIDGVGGATSTTSKVAVISPSSRPGVDVDYTFVQVAVGQNAVDFSGNCGNMCSGVGPFALQEGLVQVKPGDKTVGLSSDYLTHHSHH
jgi:hypothetical protein